MVDEAERLLAWYPRSRPADVEAMAGTDAERLLAWYRRLGTDGLDVNSGRRMEVQSFLVDCAAFLCDSASFGDPLDEAVRRAFRDVRIRSHNALSIDIGALARKVGETRALAAGSDLLLDDLTRRLRECDPVLLGSANWAYRAYRHAPTRHLLRSGAVGELIDLLGRVAGADRLRVAVVLAHRALVAAEVHDDLAGLDRAVAALTAGPPSLQWLVKAHAALLSGRRPDTLVHTGPDPLRRILDRAIAVTRGLLGEDLDLRFSGVTAAWLMVRRGLRTGSRRDLRRARWLARGRSTAARVVRAYARGRLPGARRERMVVSWRRIFAAAGAPLERAVAATAWVGWAVHTGDPDLAAEAYGTLISVLPEDVAARTGAAAKNRILAAAQEHIEDAAYWLIRAKQYRQAVMTLETGRAVAARDPGASDISYEDLAELTGDGALVYLAAARAGGYALIVAADFDPVHAEMPDLDRATVAALVQPMLAGSGTSRGADRDGRPARAAGDGAEDVLRQLWSGGLNRVVLAHAGGDVVTFIPVGLLGLLPLHAAGATNPRFRWDGQISHAHAMGYFAVRYAPNARMLRRCREIAAVLDRERCDLIAVDVPQGHGDYGEAPLAYAAEETAAVVRQWGGSGVLHLPGGTWTEFRKVAGNRAVWHLACHGSAVPRAILNSALSFADARVTLAQLRDEFRPRDRRLAVLSACESNLIGADLPNEAIGLPTALLRLGFAGVVASSWKVDDAATAYLMAYFYRLWRGGGLTPATALAYAQLWLREATRADLAAVLPGVALPAGDEINPFADARYWAAFTYTGA